jgi:hypothetical protein
MAPIDLISLRNNPSALLYLTPPSTFDPLYLSLPTSLCVLNQPGPWGNFCAQAAPTTIGDLGALVSTSTPQHPRDPPDQHEPSGATLAPSWAVTPPTPGGPWSNFRRIKLLCMAACTPIPTLPDSDG